MTYHLFRRFPRLTTVALSYLAALLLFAFLGPDFFERLILPFGLIGVFVAGVLYTYSFTSSIGALLIVSIAHDYSPGVIAVVGGIGSLLSDVAIFKFIKNDLKKEIDQIVKSPPIHALSRIPIMRARWFRDVLGAVVIASPFPDEMGIAIMATAKIKEDVFTLLTFIADMIGIYALVLVVQAAL